MTTPDELERSLAALRLEVPGEVAEHHEQIVRASLQGVLDERKERENAVLDAARRGGFNAGTVVWIRHQLGIDAESQ